MKQFVSLVIQIIKKNTKIQKNNSQPEQTTTNDNEMFDYEMLQAMAEVDDDSFSEGAVIRFFDKIDDINSRKLNAKFYISAGHTNNKEHNINEFNRFNQRPDKIDTLNALAPAFTPHQLNMQRQQLAATSEFLASHPNKLNIFVQNAHSIRGKVDEIRLATASGPFEIKILTETWLKGTISNEEHFGNKYNVYRCDRSELTS